jgi:hypothetical protein
VGTAYPIARALADRRTRALWCPRDGEHYETSIANAALNCCRNCFANFIEEMHEAVKELARPRCARSKAMYHRPVLGPNDVPAMKHFAIL